jgi:membrane protease YdiL (CAAX protease family)
MRITTDSRDPSVLQTLIIYFSILFFWHFVFSFWNVDNVDFLKYAAAGAIIYLISKSAKNSFFFGPRLKFADVAEVAPLCVATIFTGVGCWALMVFLDANAYGHDAFERWGLISHRSFQQLQWSTPWLVGHFLTSTVIVPITEEIVFRGFILRKLLQQYGHAFAIIGSSVLFALFHFDKSFIGAFVHGVIFAVLALRTSSLYAPILVHGIYNAAVFALRTIFGVSIVGDAELLSHLGYWIPELLCGIAGFVLLAVYLFNVSLKEFGRCSPAR